MHPAQVCQHREDIGGFDQCMIVVGQHAPGVNERIAISENPKQCAAECFHPFAAVTNERRVLETRGSGVVPGLVTGTMGRTMPGQAIVFPPGFEFFALLGRQLAPEITWSAHGRWFECASLPVWCPPLGCPGGALRGHAKAWTPNAQVTAAEMSAALCSADSDCLNLPRSPEPTELRWHRETFL